MTLSIKKTVTNLTIKLILAFLLDTNQQISIKYK